ncbi:hypothetical protein AYM40_30070 [Paraburkholderia phytofirmans OLGA172]|uniref:Uncharacterized protein n=1 Tax=Paraburkholderia phytofirmans OLGA172 TaxID=1417228 RepID=A0A160FU05_9BURK|nr:hypothetical protein AYM40_30070 [Paraburkholderia phytofirmans OLGA172]
MKRLSALVSLLLTTLPAWAAGPSGVAQGHNPIAIGTDRPTATAYWSRVAPSVLITFENMALHSARQRNSSARSPMSIISAALRMEMR